MKYRETGRSDTAMDGHIQLGNFIRRNVAQIVDEWTGFAETRTPASEGMTTLALRDHVEEILCFIADDLEAPQTGSEQLQKSQGNGPKEGGAHRSAAEVHADLRLSDGFDLDQLVSEYRALRACVVKLWGARNRDLHRSDFDDLVRFNEAIDQTIAESLSHYTKTLDHSRNLFLGILGHDLRNPIGAVSVSADRIAKLGTLNEQQATLAARIKDAALRAIQTLDDLLDLTRVQFGSELPIVRDKMDMSLLSRQLVDEMQAVHPRRVISLETTGNMEVEWDMLRMGQVLSNLIGNAIEHGFKDTPVEVIVEGKPQDVVLSVRNKGVPIPQEMIRTVFDSLIRGDGDGGEPAGSTHLGLGLYITRKIVGSHGGTIAVTSSEQDGTTFTVSIPRHRSSVAGGASCGSWPN